MADQGARRVILSMLRLSATMVEEIPEIGRMVEVPLVTRVVVDESVSRQLDALSDPVDVCDRQGRVLGRFLPTRDSFTPLPADECPYTPDELRDMQRETGGRSLSEIWESLRRS